METNMLGINLQTLLGSWSMSQTDLEDILKVGRGNLSNYIKGKALPKVDTLLSLEEITGIPVYYWIREEIARNMIPKKPIDNYLVSRAFDSRNEAYINTTGLSQALKEIHKHLEIIDMRLDTLEGR